MYSVSSDELDSLSSGYSSSHLSLFTLFVGTLIGFIVAVLTADLGNRLFATFIGLIVASSGLSLFFGFAAIREHRYIRGRIDEIKHGFGKTSG